MTELPAGVGYIVGGYNGEHTECLSANVDQTVHPDLSYFDATFAPINSIFERPTSFSGADNGFYGVGFQIGGGPPVPATSRWGLVLVSLALLAASTGMLMRWRRQTRNLE